MSARSLESLSGFLSPSPFGILIFFEMLKSEVEKGCQKGCCGMMIADNFVVVAEVFVCYDLMTIHNHCEVI